MRQELEPTNELVPPNSWTIESTESPPLVAANGVSYQIAKLSSKYLQQPVRYARGKFYDTLFAPPVSRRESQERITRHAAICSLLPKGTRVPNHIDIRPMADESAWWVLDEWIPSMPLASLIETGVKFSEENIKSIGTQLVETLAVLHSHSCIVRELTPERVLIEDGSTNCYITDFEMAQLLVSDISVSGKWKWTTPYRAPEVSENDTHWQSDLYSWAMIIVELLSGKPERDDDWVKQKSPSPAIAKLLIQCLDVRYHHRPSSIEKALKVWNSWSVKP
jgi:serine/threonine protein kinase